jgi:hypothetical protein
LAANNTPANSQILRAFMVASTPKNSPKEL